MSIHRNDVRRTLVALVGVLKWVAPAIQAGVALVAPQWLPVCQVATTLLSALWRVVGANPK